MRSSLLVAVLSLIVACSSEDPGPQPSGSSSGTGGQGGAPGGQSGSTQTGGGQSGAGQAGLSGSSGTSGQNNGGSQGGISGASGQGGEEQGGTNQGGAGEAGTAGQGGSGASGAQAGASGQGTGGAEQGGAGPGGSSGASGQSNGGSGPIGGTGGGNGGLAELVSAADFEAMFPNRSDPACNGGLFAYEALLEAAKAFPGFASEGSIDDRKRELAAFLANAGHETTGGWSTAPGGPQAWGLCFREEVGCDSGACTGYCVADAKYPCAPGKTYHGRGPLQLSYNYNYGQAGDALGLPLLATPELVASDGAVAFKTALWFWMTAQSPKPSCHAVMTGQWSPSSADAAAGRQPGFGMTVNIINGGIECNKPTPPQMEDRLAYYDRFTKLLGVAPGDHLTCDAMQSY